jgi:hypothetical protein
VTTWQALVGDLVHRIAADLDAVLDGLEPAALDDAVAAHTNSIGWLLWHLTRSHDRNVSELRGTPQLWLAEGWHVRFGRAADPRDTGYGHTADQVTAFRSPAPEIIRGYHQAVVRLIDAYLAEASAVDPARVTVSPTLGDTRSVQSRLVGVLVEGLEHVGQAALLGGMLERG